MTLKDKIKEDFLVAYKTILGIGADNLNMIISDIKKELGK